MAEKQAYAFSKGTSILEVKTVNHLVNNCLTGYCAVSEMGKEVSDLLEIFPVTEMETQPHRISLDVYYLFV